MMLRWRGFWKDRGVRMSIMMLEVVRRVVGIRIRVWICIRLYREFLHVHVHLDAYT